MLRGGAGADLLEGGTGGGIDTVSYFTSSVGVWGTIAGSSGYGIGGDAEGDQMTEIDNLSGSQGNDTLSRASSPATASPTSTSPSAAP